MSNIMKRNNLAPQMFRGMWDDDFFGGFFDDERQAMPAVNVVEKEGEYAVDLSVPGFGKDDINVVIDKNRLTISARKENKNEEKDSKDRVVRREFSSSSFERSFILPENIDTDKISAKQENGVLKLAIPKLLNAPEDKVKKITVG